jgi:hypothetical protein
MNLLIMLIAVWDYSYQFTTDFIYDNNIFAYSDEYIDDFVNSVNSYRFPFETYDDLIVSANLQYYLRNKFFGKHTTTFSLNVKPSHYMLNNEKDYLRIAFGIRQSFGKYALKLSFQTIPSYLIRFYKNPQGQSTDYIGCEVKYPSLEAKLSMDMKPWIRLEVRYKRTWDDYISEFDLYDASSQNISFGSNIGINERLAIWLGYGYTSLRNDSSRITTALESAPDGSFQRHVLDSEINLEFKTILPTRLKLGYTYGFKKFITEFSADSIHFGRLDHTHNISTRLDLKVFTGMYLRIYFVRQWRNATSEVSPIDIDRIKDYDKYKFGVGLSFYH